MQPEKKGGIQWPILLCIAILVFFIVLLYRANRDYTERLYSANETGVDERYDREYFEQHLTNWYEGIRIPEEPLVLFQRYQKTEAHRLGIWKKHIDGKYFLEISLYFKWNEKDFQEPDIIIWRDQPLERDHSECYPKDYINMPCVCYDWEADGHTMYFFKYYPGADYGPMYVSIQIGRYTVYLYDDIQSIAMDEEEQKAYFTALAETAMQFISEK